MTRKTILAIVLWGLCSSRPASAEIIHVPSDYSTIQWAINVASDGDEIIVSPGTYNEAIDFSGKTLILRSAQGPDVTVIDGENHNDPVVTCDSGEGPATRLEGFTVSSHSQHRGLDIQSSSIQVINCKFTQNLGGGVQILNGHGSFDGCSFDDNEADLGGAIRIDNGSATMRSCEFRDNHASGGGAVYLNDSSDAEITDSLFSENTATGGAGVFTYDNCNLALTNCIFRDNSAVVGGGLFPTMGSERLVNCSFLGNSGTLEGGGVLAIGDITLVNCTITNNADTGLQFDSPATGSLENCIVWDEITSFPKAMLTVDHSDILGGWPGVGNIDADPLFVQPGTGNLRLSFGSPCADAGNNEALPPDEFDLDDDGDTDEPIPIDLAGAARVQNGIVDMGAFEGEFEPQASGDGVENLDQGEVAMLLPCGGAPDFLESAVVFVINESGPDNASFVVECIDWDLHPDAGGFGELDTILRSATSLQDGEFLLRIFLPFDNDILQGEDPLMLNMTHLDPSLGDWRLAVAGNTQNSPGHEGPIGDRIAVANSENDFGLSTVLGDYGVFWNPSLQKGFVWANTDHAGDVGFGATLCPEDCGPIGGDGVINAIDLEHLLGSWGPSGGGPCDIDQDGRVGAFDLAQLLGAWGPCSPGGNSARWQPRPRNWGDCPLAGSCVGDVNGDGEVGPLDLATIFGLWGPCLPKEDCVADLDGDEIVGRSDLAILLGETRILEPGLFGE